MEKLLSELKALLPNVVFEPGEASFWSPARKTVTYTEGGEHASWTLLHEAAHALLGHNGYEHDVDLLLLEVAAWQKAKELSPEFGINIDDEYVQDCLDTYRDWLHFRSACPACHTVSLQVSPKEYRCHNCRMTWQVSASRFCRPYRRRTKQKETSAII
jgi:hypothetical protein